MFLLFFFFFVFFFLIQNDAPKIRVGCRPSCTYPSIHLFMELTLQLTVGCRSCTYRNSLAKNKTCTHVLDSLVRPYCKKAVLKSVPVPTNHSSPPFAVCSRRVKNREKLAHVFRLLGPCLERLQRNWHSCWVPWSVFRNSNDRRIEKVVFFLSVTVWEPGTGGQDVETQA